MWWLLAVPVVSGIVHAVSGNNSNNSNPQNDALNQYLASLNAPKNTTAIIIILVLTVIFIYAITRK